MMNRIWAQLLVFFIVCCLGIYFGCEKGGGKSQPITVKSQANDSKGLEKKYGPFDLWGSRVVVVNTIKYEDSNNTLDSFEIKNEAGLSYYKESHKNGPEGGTTLEGVFKLECKSGDGLIIYFDTEPNAPQAGKSFQIYGMEKGVVKPIAPAITVYGKLQPLQKGQSQGAVRLFDDDLIKVEEWKDFFL